MTILIILKHLCYICEQKLGNFKKLQHHLYSFNKVSIRSRPKGLRHFGNESFCHGVNNVNHSEAKIDLACHFPFSHFDEFSELKDHVELSHLNKTLENTGMQKVTNKPKKKRQDRQITVTIMMRTKMNA